jgi:ubiquinone/menaquinone biosynthesis C-methylase UbiE
MDIDYKHRDHFRKIAPSYRGLRITDIQPIIHISRQLSSLPTIKAADIGCGTGRYTKLLAHYLRDKLSFVYGIDYSVNMLKQLNQYFVKDGIPVTGTIKASAMRLPFRDESFNCLFTFNAIHHFALLEFLHESARVLQDGGYLFIYTRLRSQNSRNVWGSFFPLFTAKETRLYEADELKDAITKIPNLRLQVTRTFEFNRRSNVESLCERAMNCHYSTFDLYSRSEFEGALTQFQSNLLSYFDDPHNIRWVDENILLILQKTGKHWQVRDESVAGHEAGGGSPAPASYR